LIVRHKWFGGDNPYPQVGEHSPVFQREKSLLDLGFSLPAGASYGVEIFNDDTTPLAFVIEVLTGRVRLTERDAMAKALMIHNRGGAVFPCRTLAQAQSLASEITLEAKNRGHALLCRTVPRNAEAS
jgi:ATP-dependent Clp protease adaptor protein ClpS